MSLMLPMVSILFALLPAAMHFGLAYGLQKYECDKEIKTMGITFGTIILVSILITILLLLSAKYQSYPLAMFSAIALILLGIIKIVTIIYTMYLLYRPDGIKCWQENKSKLWLAYAILTTLMIVFMFLPLVMPKTENFDGRLSEFSNIMETIKQNRQMYA